MKLFFSAFVVTLSLASCVQFASTKYSYEKILSDSTRAKVHFVGSEPSFLLDFSKQQDSLFLINGIQLKEQLKRNEWTLVYSYLPYCSNPDMISWQVFKEKAEEKAIAHCLVLRDIVSDKFVNLCTKLSVVGMDYRHYKKLYCEDAFLKDLIGKRADFKVHRYSLFFLFHRDQLIQSGNKLDALLHLPTTALR